MINFTKTSRFLSLYLILGVSFSPFLELFCQNNAKNSRKKTLFHTDWHFTYQNKNHAAQISGSIYTDLLHNQLIKDPF
jgi:hypothetical protein